MSKNIFDNEPYASYKKICTNLLEQYEKCRIETDKQKQPYEGIRGGGIYRNPFSVGFDITSNEERVCNDKLYLIQKLCMNPVGGIIIIPSPKLQKNNP